MKYTQANQRKLLQAEHGKTFGGERCVWPRICFGGNSKNNETLLHAGGTSKSDASPGLPADISVSVVIATYDRPDLLDAFVL